MALNENKSVVRYAAQGLARFFVTHPRLFIGAVVLYILSPIDLIPEIFTGPVGYLDDFVVLLLPFIFREYAKKWSGDDKPSSRDPKKKYFDTTAR